MKSLQERLRLPLRILTTRRTSLAQLAYSPRKSESPTTGSRKRRRRSLPLPLNCPLHSGIPKTPHRSLRQRNADVSRYNWRQPDRPCGAAASAVGDFPPLRKAREEPRGITALDRLEIGVRQPKLRDAFGDQRRPSQMAHPSHK